MSNRILAELRRELRDHEAGPGRRYRDELKAGVRAFAESRRAAGERWATIAAELGLRADTVRTWCQGGSSEQRALCVVEVVPEPPSRRVAVVSPAGFRVDGLSLEEAAALLQAVG